MWRCLQGDTRKVFCPTSLSLYVCVYPFVVQNGADALDPGVCGGWLWMGGVAQPPGRRRLMLPSASPSPLTVFHVCDLAPLPVLPQGPSTCFLFLSHPDVKLPASGGPNFSKQGERKTVMRIWILIATSI